MPIHFNLQLAQAHEFAQTYGKDMADPTRLPAGMLAHPTRNPTMSEPFVKRNPAMNEVPLFYGKFETEIASLAAVQNMSEQQKEAYAIRLIAKRFINYGTGQSYFLSGDVKKANPGLHQQTMDTRVLRTQTAVQTIDQYGDGYLREAYDAVREQAQQIALQDPTRIQDGHLNVYITRPGRMEYMADCTVNFLSLASQEKVRAAFERFEQERALGNDEPALRFSTVLPSTVLSRTARSNASPVGRLVQQGYYDVSHFQKNDLVVIADDHTQAGSTLVSLGSALMEQGANVLACVTPTLHPHARHLKMQDHTRAALEAALGNWDKDQIILQALKHMGMTLDTMTDPEALILLAYATNPENVAEKDRFDNIERSLRMDQGQILEVSEGESDSLKPVLEKVYTPQEVLADIERQMKESRYVVAPLHTTDIHVLDWDDFLRREKTLNYKLLHNAVAQLANHPAKDSLQATRLPAFQQMRLLKPEAVNYFRALASAMKPGNMPEFQAGLPEVCRSIEDFEHFALGNPRFTKQQMITELIENSAQLNNDVRQALVDAKDKQLLIRALSAEFNWSYKALAQQHDRARSAFGSLPTGSGDQQAEFPLPYPEVRLELTPGAMDLLTRLRKPENRVLLISNRSDRDLNLEVDQLGLRHFFDGILGDEQITNLGQGPNGQAQAKIESRLPKKPANAKLVELMETLNTRNVKKITLWGDRKSDLTQGRSLPPPYDRIQKHGLLVNPSIELDDQTRVGLTSAQQLSRLDQPLNPA
ncbi:MAG TPA: hypothetical protein VFV39_11775 [Limnobacter sp.]|nr:hypothetical protein [Limnobacter sp.]